MEDFNNINNNENENSEGKLEGFDSVDTSKEYTVTSEGGFYTTPKENIIQDEAYKRPEPPKPNFNSAPQYNYTNPYNTSNAYNQGFYQKPKKEKKRFGVGVVIIASVLAAVIGAVSSIGATIFMYSLNDEGTEKIVTPQNKVNINVDETVESVVEAVALKVTPSVVGIRTTTSVMNFFGGTSEASGDGSGVVYRENGYIITNYHVIGDAVTNKQRSKIEVYLDSNTSEPYEATVVGYNISSDLAVIKIDVKGLSAVEFSDSDELNVGQYVITVGNPGGLEFMDSVTYGVISGLNRVVSTDSGLELIQTDAAINPGNSGGALVDTSGKLVGINSSKIVAEEFEGMGFAIPSNTVKEICDNIIDKENSPEPYIGITISERYTAEVLKYYGYPVGAVVQSVAEGSPADKAGIDRADIITEFAGKEITDYTVLEDLMREAVPGDSVEVKLYRSGRYYTTTVSIGYNNSVE